MNRKRSILDIAPLIKSGAVLFIGMSVANVGAYLFNVLVGRALGPADFGSFIALISVSLIVAVPATALATVAARFSSEYAARNATGELVSLVQVLSKIAIGLGVGFGVLGIISSSWMESFLNISNQSQVLALSIVFIVSFIPQILRGFLQGLQRFTFLAINTAVDPLIRIPLALVVIHYGFGVTGVIAVVGITYVITSLMSFFEVRHHAVGKATPLNMTPIWVYAAPTIITLVSLALLSTLDVILVKHYFSATDAGLYAALATIGKIILYISTPLVTVMFPMIVAKVSKNEKHYPLLAQTLALIALLSLLVLGVFALYPEQSVTLLFGAEFAPAAVLLTRFGFAIFFLSLATMFVHYYLSIGFTRVSWLLVATLIAETLLIVRYHGNLSEVVVSLTLTYAGLLVALVITYIVKKRQQLLAIFTDSVDVSRLTTDA